MFAKASYHTLFLKTINGDCVILDIYIYCIRSISNEWLYDNLCIYELYIQVMYHNNEDKPTWFQLST